MSLRLSILFVLNTLLGACAEPLPEPPDLTETVEAYQRGPTADVPIEEVADAVVAWLDRRGLSDELIGSGLVFEVIKTGVGLPETERPGVDPGENPREALQILEGRFSVDLFVEITHICNGHDPVVTTPDQDENGTLQIKSRLTESGFGGIFWGKFDTCRFWSDEIDLGFDFNTVTLDGESALLLLNPLGFDTERDYIFVFEGIAIFNEILLFDGRLDFLFLQDVGTEIRVGDGSGGNVFFFIPIDNPNAFELRTLNETWQCDVSLRRCLSSDGTRVSW